MFNVNSLIDSTHFATYHTSASALAMEKKCSELRLEDLSQIFEDAVYTVDLGSQQGDYTKFWVKELGIGMSLIKDEKIIRFVKLVYSKKERSFLLNCNNIINDEWQTLSVFCSDEPDEDNDYVLYFSYDYYLDDENLLSPKFIVRLARRFSEIVDNASQQYENEDP
jgi:hypothetical protein